jgi:hypothetical protein
MKQISVNVDSPEKPSWRLDQIVDCAFIPKQPIVETQHVLLSYNNANAVGHDKATPLIRLKGAFS